MNHDPLRCELWRHFNIGAHIGIHRFRQKRRVFADIHGGKRVQRNRHAIGAGGSDNGAAARIIEHGHLVLACVQLDINVAHLVARCPFNGVFKLQLAPNIHPDTVY